MSTVVKFHENVGYLQCYVSKTNKLFTSYTRIAL